MTTENGFLLIDKPTGISSFGVVAKVRGLWRAELQQSGESIKKAKVGHTGTLDPAASGLLLLVLGDYCKRASEFTKLNKTYEVEMSLGATSTTGDQEGDIVHVSSVRPDNNEVTAVLRHFVGQQLQTPPAYSAVKVNGQRAYKLAREGKRVIIQPRTVHIYSITKLRYEYPKVWFITEVSSGTYIRSLVEDIGNKLGTGAYMSNLRRTNVGRWSVADAVTMDRLTLQTIKSKLKQTTT